MTEGIVCSKATGQRTEQHSTMPSKSLDPLLLLSFKASYVAIPWQPNVKNKMNSNTSMLYLVATTQARQAEAASH